MVVDMDSSGQRASRAVGDLFLAVVLEAIVAVECDDAG
jgi:hypothetical protein